MGEETEKAPIGVVGVGWVGLVTAACFAEMGHPVVARDIVAERIEALRAGEVPMHEPGLPELVSGNADRLTFTTEVGELLEHAKLVFIAVETPPTASGDADLSSVMTAIEEVGTGGDHAVVMKSTVPVGTGRTIRRELPGVSYVSNPEFLREGSAVKDFMNPDRVVIGAEPEDADAADQLQQAYEPLGAPMVRTDIASAEMIKLASNAFLATKISFINEIANVSEQLGADVDEVARGVGLDQRIGPKFLKAGIGWGGSCFGKDVSGLKQAAGNTGYHFQLLSAVMEVNELQKRRAVGKLTDHLGDLGGKTVALLGLAFKPDTDDMRDAASIVIAARLAGEGAKVVAYDPVAQARASELMPNVEMKSSALEALDGADAVVLVTEWPEFAELDWSEAAGRMATPLLVDGRNFLPADELRAVGFTYEGIGRPAGAEGQALMQALILVGGEGTRLRPLTERRPKPVLPLVGQPFISYMLEWLRSHGVDEVVMACGFEPDALRETIGSGDAEQRVRYLVEPDPRGTAGAIRFAKEDLQERFFVLNGDVLCDLDLTELMREHTENQAIATIGLFGVADATGYGLVHRDADGWVTEFAEKPGPEEAAAGGNINAGAYVLEHAVLERIPPDREVSIERDVFPTLVGRGLRGAALDGYWLDIGTPERFLQASWDILEGRVETEIGKRAPDGLLVAEGAEISPEATIRAPAAIADGVVVEAGAEVGPRAVIDKGSRVAEGAVVERSLIGEGCSVGAGAALRGAILAPRVEVEPEAELGPGSVVGEDEKVPAREGASMSNTDAIRAVDKENELDAVLAMPDHLRDALWRIESAKLKPVDAPTTVICGMGGSAIGGDLARAALGQRLARPLVTARGYELPPAARPDSLVVCSSYSGNTEETLACYEGAEALGATRIVATTNGKLAEQARADDVPVIGLPAGLQPRASVGYMFTVAAEAAALGGGAERLNTEIDSSAAHLEERRDALIDQAAEIAAGLADCTTIINGCGLTAPVAYRWKTQLNENGKVPAFASQLPEADHNEIAGWEGASGCGRFTVVFLEDSDQHPRERQRIELTAKVVEPHVDRVLRIETEGETRTERMLAAVMLGDLVSLHVAAHRGIDPSPVPAIEQLKDALGRP